MKTAKILSLLAFILYLISFLFFTFSFLRLLSLYREFNVGVSIYKGFYLLIPLSLAIISLAYWFYLRRVEARKGKSKYALLISLGLLLMPLVVYYFLFVSMLVMPIYDLSSPGF